MKRQFAIILIMIFCVQHSLSAFDIEVNSSYDHYRGLADGSWNGNTGALFLGNIGIDLYNGIGIQLGGSYSLYNWEGRENLVFKNPKKTQRQTFGTIGAFTSFKDFCVGLTYDRLSVKHFGIYDVHVGMDQLRFQGGYRFCDEEIGVWGTIQVSTAHTRALGAPLSFRAINQINAFWSHFFDNCATTTLWLGLPYGDSLISSHKSPGTFVTGFSLRVPLTNKLFIDGHGMYMGARGSSGIKQCRNYGANICIGITYLFIDYCSLGSATYMPVANNSNFLVDTNMNQ